jgi:translation initiation factor IF-1
VITKRGHRSGKSRAVTIQELEGDTIIVDDSSTDRIKL